MLFEQTDLYEIIDHLGIRTPQEQIRLWSRAKKKRFDSQQLVQFYGKKLTKGNGGYLAERGITREQIERWKDEAKDVDEFFQTLKDHRMLSPRIQEALCQLYFGKSRPV